MRGEAKHWRAWAMAMLDLEPGGTVTDSELRGLIELDLTTEWERANAAEDEIARLRGTEIRLRELLRRAEATGAENMRLALARNTKCEPARIFPVCGAWHDHYNRCEQPAGHAGDHVFDRLRWERGGGGDGLLRPAKPASQEERALAVARLLHRAFDDANVGKEPLHDFDVTLECGVRDNWIALGQKAIELGATVKDV